MQNIKSLMIHDWVNVRGTIDFPQIDRYGIEYIKTLRVAEILDEKIRCDDGELYDRVMPVSLNEELLRRNGFTYDVDRETYILSPLFQLKKNKTDFVWENTLYPLQINTVHALQHFLRLCCMDSLADNFKLK